MEIQNKYLDIERVKKMFSTTKEQFAIAKYQGLWFSIGSDFVPIGTFVSM